MNTSLIFLRLTTLLVVCIGISLFSAPSTDAQTPPTGVISVDWSSDGTMLVSGGTNGLLQVTDPAGNLILNISGLTGTIGSVTWSPDSNKFAAALADDLTIRVWNVSDTQYTPGELLTTFTGHESLPTSVDWSPDGTLIASAGLDEGKEVKLWDTVTFQPNPVAEQSTSVVYQVDWSPDSNRLAVATFAGLLVFEKTLNIEPFANPANHRLGNDTIVYAVDWSPDGSTIAASYANNSIALLDVNTGATLATLQGHTDFVNAVAWNPTGTQLASASQDGTIRVWDSASGTQLTQINKLGNTVATTSIAWNPAGTAFAYGDEAVQPVIKAPPIANAGPDQTVVDTDHNGTQTVTLDGTASTGTISTYAWSENGTPLASGATPQVTLSVGIHTITLTVTDNDGLTSTDTVVVTVQAPPIAHAGPDQTVTDADGNGTENVTLNGSGSTDADGTIDTYLWTENGVLVATSVNPTYSATLSVGVHTILLTVTDNDGLTDTDTVVITVQAPPIADAGPDQTVTDTNGDGSEAVAFNGTGSSDSDGTISTYQWSENGTPIGSGANAEVTLNVGVHTITLTVTDNDGLSDTDTVVITVNEQPSTPLVVSMACNANHDLVITISSGTAPFGVTASGWTFPPPDEFRLGDNIVSGPGSWQDVTVSASNGEQINLGNINCRPDAPVLTNPPHLTHLTSGYVIFTWLPVTGANTYEIWVFDDAQSPTFEILESMPAPPNPKFIASDPLVPVGRFFWRVRAKVNNVWSVWSTRFTFWVDPPGAQFTEGLSTISRDSRSIDSEGLTDDSIELSFSGDQLGIVFKTGPEFEAMTIEIDGEVFSTIYPDQPASEGMIELYTLPEDGEHTMRVYGPDGAAAFEAFLVEESP